MINRFSCYVISNFEETHNGPYVRAGAGLLDLANPGQWLFETTLAGTELSGELVESEG